MAHNDLSMQDILRRLEEINGASLMGNLDQKAMQLSLRDVISSLEAQQSQPKPYEYHPGEVLNRAEVADFMCAIFDAWGQLNYPQFCVVTELDQNEYAADKYERFYQMCLNLTRFSLHELYSLVNFRME